jgi:CDP-6-deoxy-D-xylo-4-hexulose-3-dehydrase
MTLSFKKKMLRLVNRKVGTKRFMPGKTPIPVSGKVYDERELLSGVEAVMDGWWTEGRFAREFEKRLSAYLGVPYITLVNSGSSANLLALSCLTSPIFGERAIRPGDEVITAGCAFPTTVNPILQNRCIPVFVDCDLSTKNPTVASIKRAITKKTKAIMLAHTLGNPLAVHSIRTLAKSHGLWFIEDSCDALGGTYGGKQLGSFGDISTFSFYPAHQITMGEGGAVCTANPLIYRSLRQFRDWGRDCWCGTGEDDTCHKRFGWKLGDLPKGYDHKYIYSQIGYNLKLTDMQAAIGLAQLEKLPSFIEKRGKTYDFYEKFFSKYTTYFVRTVHEPAAKPSWFGYMIVVADSAPFGKQDLVLYLEDHAIATRSLFAGNITRHPAYIGRNDIRVAEKLSTCDKIMNDGFWIGVYPGITAEMSRHVAKTVEDFLKERT